VVFVEHHQRHEPVAGIGQCDCHRPGVEIEHGSGIERVAIGSDHRLLVDLHRLAVMKQLSSAASFLHRIAHIKVGLGANEVIDSDRHGCLTQRRGDQDEGAQGQQNGSFHDVNSSR
jgi:hypothetical protein